MSNSRVALTALAATLMIAPAVVRAQAAMPAGAPITAAQSPSQTMSQGAPDSTVRRHHLLAHRLFRGIALTKDQRTQLKAIAARYAPDIKAARESGDRKSANASRLQMIADARGVLTPDQQTQFDANRAAMRAAWKARAANRGAAPASPAAPDGSAPAPAPSTPQS
jgi:Spy/CpxP family protein refolding chaperone